MIMLPAQKIIIHLQVEQARVCNFVCMYVCMYVQEEVQFQHISKLESDF